MAHNRIGWKGKGWSGLDDAILMFGCFEFNERREGKCITIPP